MAGISHHQYPGHALGELADEERIDVDRALAPGLGWRRGATLALVGELDSRNDEQRAIILVPGDLVVIGEDDEVVPMLGVPANDVAGRGVTIEGVAGMGVGAPLEVAGSPVANTIQIAF